MQIDDKLVQHLATLGRLHFTAEEADAIKADLGKMTAFIEKLNELDTSGVEPLRHMQVLSSAEAALGSLRNDEPATPMLNDAVLAEASQKKPPYFVVPKVLPR